MNTDPLLSRKFLYAILVLLLGFVLVIVKTITGDSWINLAQTIGGIYVIGNVADQFVATKEQKLG